LAEFTNQDLKLAREALKMPRWKLATDVNVSESTSERWETGETQPHPDEVDRIAAALGDPTIWHRWMLSNYDSYRKRYINGNNGLELPVALMNVRHELSDVLKLQDHIERDSVDGRIDDQSLKAAYTKEVKEALAALANSLQRLV
jgi:transcriptional regulator with XRE-family HTH domain